MNIENVLDNYVSAKYALETIFPYFSQSDYMGNKQFYVLEESIREFSDENSLFLKEENRMLILIIGEYTIIANNSHIQKEV
jgi:hypothetical protein